ncbi:FAD binding domain-containing protein [Umbelopsis sp. AD052]|nr:FAD binding domain-containing protein [Umbelopsis sp. AD052]
MVAKQDYNSHVTVLIVGAGPAGAFLASNLARLGLQFRLIDKLKVHTTGRAIGVVARTLEVLEQVIGPEITHNLVNNGHQVKEQGFWRNGKLTKKTESWDCDSLYNYYLIHPQLGIEDALQKDIQKFGQEVEFGVRLVDISVPADPEEPILCTLKHEETGELEHMTCKYLIGADGAHSFVRRSMGITTLGDTPNMVWGIVDAVVKTDFDAINQSNILYTDKGTAVAFHWGNGITRLAMYLGSPDLAKDVANYRDIRNYLSIDQFLERITTAFTDSGFSLEIGEVKWFSIFKIQEKISADWFAADGRVILVGDACHTHSPGGGLGMQAGIMDSYNLAWKLKLMESGLADKSILNTYMQERREVAEQFIETSAKIIRVMSNMTPANTSPGLNSSYEKELALLYKRNGANITVGPSYNANEICWDGSGSIERNYAFWKSATTVRPGQRAPDVFDLRQYNLKSQTKSDPLRLFTITKYPGIFNIMVFTNDLNDEVQYNLSSWSAHLEESDAFYTKYKYKRGDLFAFHTVTTADVSVIDNTSDHVNRYFSTHSTIILDRKNQDDADNNGEVMYGSTFLTAAEMREQSAHAKYGIPSDENGVIIVLRPDGYIACVVCLEDWAHLDEYFDGILGGNPFASANEDALY